MKTGDVGKVNKYRIKFGGRIEQKNKKKGKDKII